MLVRGRRWETYILTNRIFDDSNASIVSGPGIQSGSDAGPGLFKRLSRYDLKSLSVSCLSALDLLSSLPSRSWIEISVCCCTHFEVSALSFEMKGASKLKPNNAFAVVLFENWSTWRRIGSDNAGHKKRSLAFIPEESKLPVEFLMRSKCR